MSAIFTVGHWIHSAQDFTQMLHEQGIELLVDIRSFPGSMKSPQFNKEVLPVWLDEAGILYLHMPSLGGRKRGFDKAGQNGAWQNPSFGSYADHTLSAEWKKGFNELIDLSLLYRTCYMCGEPHPARCHRLIVSDNMEGHGIEVYHIIKQKLDEPAHVERHIPGRWGAHPEYHEKHAFYPSTAPMQTTLGL